ncbi:MAG: transposase [Rhodothalassiaceae bacterium]|nr:MAG: transposase [Rhodothalassiaceae bacterium]
MSVHLSPLELLSDGSLPPPCAARAAHPLPRRMGREPLPVAARAGWAVATPGPMPPRAAGGGPPPERLGGGAMKEWWTARELASARLPGLPTSLRRLRDHMRRHGWDTAVGPDGAPLSRPRTGRGGGREYHISLLPPAARRHLDDGKDADAQPARATVDWALWERASERERAIAARRAELCRRVAEMAVAGAPVRGAIAEVAAGEPGVSAASLRRWWYGDGRRPPLAALPRGDWPVVLLPHRRGGAGAPRADIHPELWEILKADWLRPEQPSIAACWRRLKRVAEQRGWPVPSYDTVRRRLAELPWQVVVLAREGEEALKRRLDHVTRSRAHLAPLDAVTADGHTIDLRVRLPSGRIGRPVLIAWQDLYSGMILAWRLGEAPSAHLVRLSFWDMARAHGVPRAVYLDNGREFTAKWLSGGVPHRYRWRVRDEDPVGLFRLLDISVHWTTPYHGQAKPIERAFGTLAEEISRHPDARGAYTGPAPHKKPHDYGRRVLEWETLQRIVTHGIHTYNETPGRRTETARGRSFGQTFRDALPTAVIRRASEEQLRLCMLACEGVRVRRCGGVFLARNRYWADFLPPLIGREVVLRFDPDDLAAPVHVYLPDGRYLGAAARTAAAFDDIASARAVTRARRRRIRAAKEMLAAQREESALAALAAPDRDEAADARPAAVELIRPAPPRRESEADLDYVRAADAIVLSMARARAAEA